MQNNFGLDDMLFEVETVMAHINDEAPSPFLELVPLEGSMVGSKFIIGEFRITDETYENGDGEMQFSVSFPEKTKKENDEMVETHAETINKIVINMLEDLVKNENT